MKPPIPPAAGLATVLLLLLALSPLAGGELRAQADNQAQTQEQPHQHAVEDTATAPSVAAGQVEEQANVDQKQEPEAPGITDFLTSGKYVGFLILMVVGVGLLFARWIRPWVRIVVMAAAFVLYGLDYFFPLHPSPMCALTKAFMFKFTMGQFFPVFLALLIAMLLPSLIGRKFFCGWVCPLGALQELVNKIPFKPRFKHFNFAAFNAIRMSFLALFVLTFFFVKDQIAALGQQVGTNGAERTWAAFSAYNVYDPVNFFELLHWQIDTIFLIMMTILVLASLVLYRPFCYLLCPVGAVTWLLEKVAPLRVYVDQDACIECGECVEKSPCPTIEPMYERRKVLPDCTSCGECLATCEENAIKFGLVRRY